MTARFCACQKPLVDAHGSDQSHDRKGVVTALSTLHPTGRMKTMFRRPAGIFTSYAHAKFERPSTAGALAAVRTDRMVPALTPRQARSAQNDAVGGSIYHTLGNG